MIHRSTAIYRYVGERNYRYISKKLTEVNDFCLDESIVYSWADSLTFQIKIRRAIENKSEKKKESINFEKK